MHIAQMQRLKYPIAQRCDLPVSSPVDLLLSYVVVNPPESKLAKRTSVHWSNADAQYGSFYDLLSLDIHKLE